MVVFLLTSIRSSISANGAIGTGLRWLKSSTTTLLQASRSSRFDSSPRLGSHRIANIVQNHVDRY